MRVCLSILFALLYFVTVADNVQKKYRLSGRIVSDSGEPVEDAIVSIPSENIIEFSNFNGQFLIRLEPGTYELEVHRLGFTEVQQTIEIVDDAFIEIVITQNSELEEIVVESDAIPENFKVGVYTALEAKEINLQAGKSLGEAVSRLPGVSLLQTGPNITKPVIHGLHSNRVSILVNKVILGSQQWGNEHAPEVDPFFAKNISVVKGSESVRYGGGALAGIVLLDPPKLSSDFGANVITSFQSNNRQGSISGRLNGGVDAIPGLKWNAQATWKKGGDYKTPDYRLSNTGVEELNFSGIIGYEKDWYSLELFYSRFDSEIGILRGAHIGSITDLERILEQGRPDDQFIQSFSYDIDNPKQDVEHNIWKVENNFDLKSGTRITAAYSYQNNKRKEFDVRRTAARSDIPALDMELQTHRANVSVKQYPAEGWLNEYGFSFGREINNNVPGTGTTPLIPAYRKILAGIYFIENIDMSSSVRMELSGRYDFEHLEVLTFDRNDQFVNPKFTFNNINFSAGLVKFLDRGLTISSHLGYTNRNPHVNELFSSGLHHGSASIENGLLIDDSFNVFDKAQEVDIESEKSLKWVSELNLERKSTKLDLDLYFQNLQDFIALEPGFDTLTQTDGSTQVVPETNLSIRGAFPIFEYRRRDGWLTGFEARFQQDFLEKFSLDSRLAMLFAWNADINDYFVFMPADRLESRIYYNSTDFGVVTNARLGFGTTAVREQTRVPDPEVWDFAPPPDGYILLDFILDFDLDFADQKLGVAFAVENLANTNYRGYLNRLRYYAGDVGRNFRITLNYKFNK